MAMRSIPTTFARMAALISSIESETREPGVVSKIIRQHRRHKTRMSALVISKEYLYTAQALLRVARNITDGTVANRLMALAADYERRARKADLPKSN